MTDTLTVQDSNTLTVEVEQAERQNVEIQGGADAFIKAVATAFFQIQDKDDDLGQDAEKSGDLDEIRTTLERIDPLFMSSLATANVGGVTAEELNVALEQIFINDRSKFVDADGIASAELVMKELGIEQGSLSFKAQTALSGLMTGLHNEQNMNITIHPPMIFEGTPGMNRDGLRPIPPDAHEPTAPINECDKKQEYGPGRFDPNCVKI